MPRSTDHQVDAAKQQDPAADEDRDEDPVEQIEVGTLVNSIEEAHRIEEAGPDDPHQEQVNIARVQRSSIVYGHNQDHEQRTGGGARLPGEKICTERVSRRATPVGRKRPHGLVEWLGGRYGPKDRRVHLRQWFPGGCFTAAGGQRAGRQDNDQPEHEAGPHAGGLAGRAHAALRSRRRYNTAPGRFARMPERTISVESASASASGTPRGLSSQTMTP